MYWPLVVTVTNQQIYANKAECHQSSKALMHHFHCKKKKLNKSLPITVIWYGDTFLQIYQCNCGTDYQGPPAPMPHCSFTEGYTIK